MNNLPLQRTALAQKTSNKIWIIVVIVLLVLCCLCTCIGGAGVYFYSQNQVFGIGETFNNSTPLTENKGQAPQLNGVTLGDEKRVDKGGFAFKVIPGYKVENMSDTDIVMTVNGYKNDTDGPIFLLSGKLYGGDNSLEMITESGNEIYTKNYKGTLSEAQQITISGYKGLAFDASYDRPNVGKVNARKIYVEVSPTQFFVFECHAPLDKWAETRSNFDSIVSSVTLFEAKP
jgi:hypothetical protein